MNISQLSPKAKAIYTLCTINLIDNNELYKALQDKIITNEEYDFILEKFNKNN